MPRVLFTGGGTAGHVTPNVALIEAAQLKGWSVFYVGSKNGIENEIISRLGVPFKSIATGKLHRYFSWENFIAPFMVLLGIIQSLGICIREKPDVVFSKGGYVSVPVAIAAWLCRIPVISHESDVTPGLANRVIYPVCRKICVTFAETVQFLPMSKVVVSGTPVRASLLAGNAVAGFEALGLSGDRPLLLVFGGSTGARAINQQVTAVADRLVIDFDIIHLVGEGNLSGEGEAPGGYLQREYLHEEFGDVLAASSLVVSRAGANSIYELLVTRKPHLLVPLTRAASRGDQLVNAETFERRGYSKVLYEEELNDESFIMAVNELYEHRQKIQQNLGSFEVKDSVAIILDQMLAVTKVY